MVVVEGVGSVVGDDVVGATDDVGTLVVVVVPPVVVTGAADNVVVGDVAFTTYTRRTW
jgi:hypothetical protein